MDKEGNFRDIAGDLRELLKEKYVSELDWPEGEEALSDTAYEAINALLTLDPEHRPAGPEVQQKPHFASIDWEHLLEAVPPFIPQPDSLGDTSYFQARNILQHLSMSNFEM